MPVAYLIFNGSKSKMASTLFFFNCVTTCSFLYELIIDTFGNCKPLLFHSFRASSVGSEKTLIFSGALPGFILFLNEGACIWLSQYDFYVNIFFKSFKYFFVTLGCNLFIEGEHCGKSYSFVRNIRIDLEN